MTSNGQLPLFPAGEPGDELGPSDAAARRFAVDPRHNVVLEASAGTGKTSVLVERYLNLLRAGVEPAHVLAITFTRQAAAEMRGRIIAQLRSDAERSAAGRARWVTLRDRLAEVSISTVDAFCLSLLREFPLEADLDPTFGMADDTEVPRLVDEAVERTMALGAGLARDDAAIAMLLAQLGPSRARRALTHLLQRRLVVPTALHRFLIGSPRGLTGETVCRDTARRLGDRIAPQDPAVRGLLESGPLDDPAFALVAADLARLPDLPARDEAAIRATLDRLRRFFLTRKGTVRKTFRTMGQLSSAARRRYCRSAATLAPVVHEVCRGFDRDLNVVLVGAVQRLFGVAVSEYRRGLDARAELDFSDVLQRAVELLRQMDEFARSRYRLESRYHHVLVDEFQDTSRAQWELISLLVAAWGEGSGLVAEAAVPPTIFIVGDRKQSIYRFRDADVGVLREAGQAIARLRPEGDVHRSISHSFRSVRGLLSFVNDLFEEIGQGPDVPEAFRYDATDRFPIDRVEAPPPAAAAPVGLVVGEDVEACAASVAAEVERLLDEEQVRKKGEVGLRPLRAGDIGILFRARESHREFERALAARAIPTYVYKGLGFFDADETKDVRVLVRFLANPVSELRAAALLRSRLAGIGDRAILGAAGQLSRLLVDEAEPAVVGEMRPRDQDRLRLLRRVLARWLPRVDHLPPAAVVDGVLRETAYAFELRGTHVQPARENLKKVRALVRRLENRGYATMRRVADEVDHLSPDISTAVVEALDAVNLMTVHAAKGLEFPVVFLVDLGRGTGPDSPAVQVVADRGDGRPAVAVWPYRPESDEPTRSRQLDEEEIKRLLYVALTRARDRLYLSATVRDSGPVFNRGSFGTVLPGTVVAAFESAAGGVETIDWRGPHHRHRLTVLRASPTPAADDGKTAERLPAAVPRPRNLDRVRWPAASTGRATDPPHPSDGSEGAREAPDPADRERLVGAVAHRLIPRHLRSGIDRDGLAHEASALLGKEPSVDAAEREFLALRAAQVVDRLRRHPRVREIAEAACLFEVPFSHWESDPALVPAPMLVRGTVDCLARTASDRVVVLEFKTGAARPHHRRQLALYLSAVRATLPISHVEGHLVYAGEPNTPLEWSKEIEPAV